MSIAAGHGCYPLRGVATYEDVAKLTYLRGPSGIRISVDSNPELMAITSSCSNLSSLLAVR